MFAEGELIIVQNNYAHIKTAISKSLQSFS